MEVSDSQHDIIAAILECESRMIDEIIKEIKNCAKQKQVALITDLVFHTKTNKKVWFGLHDLIMRLTRWLVGEENTRAAVYEMIKTDAELTNTLNMVLPPVFSGTETILNLFNILERHGWSPSEEFSCLFEDYLLNLTKLEQEIRDEC